MRRAIVLSLASAIASALPACGCGAEKDPWDWDGIADSGDTWADLGDTAFDPGYDTVPPDLPGGDIEEETCGGSDFSVSRVIPDIMVLLDRSNSMSYTPPSPSLWNVIRDAISTVTLPPRDSSIWFGLMSFPGPTCSGTIDQCINPSATDIMVPVAPDNHDEIYGALFAPSFTTCGGTPIAMSLDSAGLYLGSLTDGHPKYVLLATDGAPNCNASLPGSTCICTNTAVPGACTLNNENCLDNDRTNGVLDALCAAGIHTYVLGMGGAADWAVVMSSMALHGCTSDYFAADDPAGIASALDTIAGAVATCDFEMNCADIPDPTQVNFFFEPGHIVIPRNATDHTYGWDWSETCPAADGMGTVTFYGADCDAIMTGAHESVSAEFGCPTVFI